MSRLDELPADQKAVLQLLLKQGKSYEELAQLLRLDADAVRERALDALDALGPDAPEGLSSQRQDEISDYLLGQQTASGRAETREFLQNSAAGRAWARVIAGELKPLAANGLPEIPADSAELEEAFEARDAREEARERHERSSKLGGVLVIAGVAIALTLLVLVLAGGLGGDDEDEERAATPTTTQQTSTAAQDGFLAQINLRPTREGSKALGAAFVVEGENGKPGIQVAGQDLAESNRYAVWLYTSGTRSSFLGFARYVGNGRIIGVKPELPGNWRSFREVIVTRERVNRPKRPGTIVLRGPLQA